MDRLAACVKRVLDVTLLPFFAIIIILGILRTGPFFCAIDMPCLLIQRDTFFFGYLLSISASTFYGVLSFWATIIGLLGIILSFNKKAIPDLVLEAPDGCTTDKSRHFVEVPYQGTFPLTLKVGFLVKNNGTLPIQSKNAIAYLIKFPKTLEILEQTIDSGLFNEGGNKMVPKLATRVENQIDIQTLGGEIPTTVHPNRLKRLFEVHLKFTEARIYNIEYYFSTESGFFPSQIKYDENNEPNKNLGRITINIK